MCASVGYVPPEPYTAWYSSCVSSGGFRCPWPLRWCMD